MGEVFEPTSAYGPRAPSTTILTLMLGRAPPQPPLPRQFTDTHSKKPTKVYNPTGSLVHMHGPQLGQVDSCNCKAQLLKLMILMRVACVRLIRLIPKYGHVCRNGLRNVNPSGLTAK